MINKSEQRKHFDKSSSQYSIAEILSRPLFIELECRHIESFLLKKKSRVVDFGCGTGRIAMYLLEKGHDVLAVDISSKSLKELKRIYLLKRTKRWGRLKVSKKIMARIMMLL